MNKGRKVNEEETKLFSPLNPGLRFKAQQPHNINQNVTSSINESNSPMLGGGQNIFKKLNQQQNTELCKTNSFQSANSNNKITSKITKESTKKPKKELKKTNNFLKTKFVSKRSFKEDEE